MAVLVFVFMSVLMPTGAVSVVGVAVFVLVLMSVLMPAGAVPVVGVAVLVFVLMSVLMPAGAVPVVGMAVLVLMSVLMPAGAVSVVGVAVFMLMPAGAVSVVGVAVFVLFHNRASGCLFIVSLDCYMNKCSYVDDSIDPGENQGKNKKTSGEISGGKPENPGRVRTERTVQRGTGPPGTIRR